MSETQVSRRWLRSRRLERAVQPLRAASACFLFPFSGQFCPLSSPTTGLDSPPASGWSAAGNPRRVPELGCCPGCGRFDLEGITLLPGVEAPWALKSTC